MRKERFFIRGVLKVYGITSAHDSEALQLHAVKRLLIKQILKRQLRRVKPGCQERRLSRDLQRYRLRMT